jgi:hypothetical protein
MRLTPLQQKWLDLVEVQIELIMDDFYALYQYRSLNPRLAKIYFESGRWE